MDVIRLSEVDQVSLSVAVEVTGVPKSRLNAVVGTLL